jgi:hypothetical protein
MGNSTSGPATSEELEELADKTKKHIKKLKDIQYNLQLLQTLLLELSEAEDTSALKPRMKMFLLEWDCEFKKDESDIEEAFLHQARLRCKNMKDWLEQFWGEMVNC